MSLRTPTILVRNTLLLVVFSLLLSSLPTLTLAETPAGDWCYTQVFYAEKVANNPLLRDPEACFQYSLCDYPEERDDWVPAVDKPITYIRLYFHLFANDDGSSPAATADDVAEQVNALNTDYLPYRIQFEYLVDSANSTQFRWITSTSEFDQMKNAYAISPDEYLNIFVVDVNINGSVYSFATFPWDGDVTSNTGGIVMNDSQFWPQDAGTLPHEMGHALGLWHTHHGVSEVSQCGACYESVGASDRDYTGDFCSDTDPTPTNYACNGPGGTDPCSGSDWGPTDPQNYMGYAPSFCYTEFSTQQSGRMHCWINEELLGWTIPLAISGTNTFGAAPLTVDFDAATPRTVTDWAWNFGDGGAAGVQSPTHDYAPGYYNVGLTITTPQGPFSEVIEGMVSAYADTMWIEQVEGEAGEVVKVDVYAQHYLPLKEITIPFGFAGPLGIVYDSFSTAGTRTDYFDIKSQVNYDFFNDRAAVYLNCSNSGTQPYLSPGSGPIASLWFTIPGGAPSGENPINLISYNGFDPEYTSYAGTYQPVANDGFVLLDPSCCTGPSVGNVDASPDNQVTMGDLTVLIDHLFISLEPLACDVEGNVDGSLDGQVTMGDLTILIDHLFISLSPLMPCP